MAGFDLNSIVDVLNEAKGYGVSFESQAKKWETEAGAEDLIGEIAKCTNLQYLNLEGNSLGVDAARGIGKALEKHPEFKKALFKDLFTGRLKTEIPQALQAMGRGMITAGAKLTVFDCSDNALGPNGMVGLVELFKSPACYSLQELKLNNCGLGIGGGEMLAKALLDGYEASVKAGTPLQLKTFIAGRNRLENAGAKALSEFFKKVGTLEHVAMPQNGIYHPGITALSEGFRNNPNMKTLNLNDNTIGPIGAEAIAEALYSMPNLEEINFGDCLLKSRGAIILAEALQDGHFALETLILEANEIGPNGGCAVASAVINKEQLQKLALNANQFGEEGRETVKEILEDHRLGHTLDELDEDDSDGEEEDDDEVGDGEDDEDDEDTCEAVDPDDQGYYQGDESTNTNMGSLNWSLNTTAAGGINSSISFLNASELSNTVESFVMTPQPTLDQLIALEEKDKLQAFREYLSTITEKDYLTYLVFTIIKIASISEASGEALNIATELIRDCYAHAEQNNQVHQVNQFFLTQMGLLKCEDKKFQSQYNTAAVKKALSHAMKMKVVSDNVVNMLLIFLEIC